MKSLNESIEVYRKLMAEGHMLRAYQGIIGTMMELRTFFLKEYPELNVSSSIYQGYMDMTFFAVTSDVLKQRQLKVAIVFLHEPIRFEAWLSASNKRQQKKNWELIRDAEWHRYQLEDTIEGRDAIIRTVLVEKPDFDHKDQLKGMIEKETLQFIKNLEAFYEGN